MSDDFQDKTEQPTPKRRDEARKKGNVAKSRDLSGALVVVPGILLVLAADRTVAVFEEVRHAR